MPDFESWLAQVKSMMRIAPEETEQDGVLMLALGTAWEMAQEHTRRRFELQDWVEEHDGPWRHTLGLCAYPVESMTTVEVDGVPLEGYRLDAKRGVLYAPLGGVRGRLTRIEYRAGYAEDMLPLPIRQACILLAVSMAQSGAHGGKKLIGERLGDYQVTYAAGSGQGIQYVCPAAFALLRPYVRPMM